MALFKIFKGNQTDNLLKPQINGEDNPNYREPVDGYAYYDTNSKLFYIDADYTTNQNGTISRQPINADHANSATLAQAAVYETTNTIGDIPNEIRSFYAHGITKSGNNIYLTNGNGQNIAGASISLNEYTEAINSKQNKDIVLQYQDNETNLIWFLLGASDNPGVSFNLDEEKFINKTEFLTFINSQDSIWFNENLYVQLLASYNNITVTPKFRLNLLGSLGSGFSLIGSVQYGDTTYILSLSPNNNGNLNGILTTPNADTTVYYSSLGNNNILTFNENITPQGIWNDISDDMDHMGIVSKNYGHYFILFSKDGIQLTLPLIGYDQIEVDDTQNSYRAIFSTCKDDIIYTAYVYQYENDNNKSHLEISSVNDKLNLALNNYLPLSGGTMTGNLILNTNPSSNMQAANKQYVDNSINSLDVSNISGFGTGKTLKTLTETDGKIAATFQDIAITKSQITDFPGYWANIVTTTTATYNKEPEFKTMKLGNGTSATGTKSVQLVYDATLEALNFVFA